MSSVSEQLVARPGVYDFVQMLAGASVVRLHLAALVPVLRPGAFIVDIGAGTGLYRSIWPSGCRYLCVDLDPVKIHRFRSRHRDPAVQADAVRLPFVAAGIDVIVCTLMSHHLDDDAWIHMLDEIQRVLRPGGVFLFVDPVWQASRPPGRWLWRFDRGRHPRTAVALRTAIGERFRIDRVDDFAVWHRYAACLATRI